MAGELPQKLNRRGGAGWWMDEQGRWRDPQDWPGNEPPVTGWVRSDSGAWCPPVELIEDREADVDDESIEQEPVERATASRSNTSPEPDDETAEASATRGSQVAALLVAGTAVAVAVVISVGVLLTQSGAEALPESPTSTVPEVVFAADTEEFRMERRIETAADAPAVARSQLAELTDLVEPPNASDAEAIFDETVWEAQPTDCLDPTELVLIERTTTPIVWADNLECVPAEGLWFDPYVEADIRRTIDAEVRSLLPLEIVHSSGGHEWTPSTRALFVNDVAHPATLVILRSDSGYNPRGQSPDQWRPSNESTWCGYAIDWIAVKHRWELHVTAGERDALTEMLQTCADPTSTGPHLTSMVIDVIEPPVIERIEAN